MPNPDYLLVAALTLAVLASLTVWGKRSVRLMSSIIDEHRFDFTIRYFGDPLEIPTERPQVTLDEDPMLVRNLSAYMLSSLADSVRSRHTSGTTEIEIHFEH